MTHATQPPARPALPVVLVTFDWVRRDDPLVGLGAASIVASLTAAGVQVTRVERAVNLPDFDPDEAVRAVAAAVRAAGPDALLALGAYVWNDALVQRVLREVQARTVVVGGPQITFAPKGSLEDGYPGCHVFVRGHGEAAMAALARGEADPVGVHRAGAPDRGLLAQVALDALPSPHLDGTLTPSRYVRWETQRGCIFRCSFCQHRDPGRRTRPVKLASPRLRAELEAFQARGVTRISVLDPIFHQDPEHALTVLAAAKEVGLTATLSLQCRFELVTDAFLDALDGLRVELEFGLQTADREEGLAVGRPNDLRKVEAAVGKLLARGIPFEVSLIYGLPGQTPASFARSVAWCRARGVRAMLAFPLMLLRGTELERARGEWGFEEEEREGIPYVVASHTFDRADHRRMEALARDLEAERQTVETELSWGTR